MSYVNTQNENNKSTHEIGTVSKKIFLETFQRYISLQDSDNRIMSFISKYAAILSLAAPESQLGKDIITVRSIFLAACDSIFFWNICRKISKFFRRLRRRVFFKIHENMSNFFRRLRRRILFAKQMQIWQIFFAAFGGVFFCKMDANMAKIFAAFGGGKYLVMWSFLYSRQFSVRL